MKRRRSYFRTALYGPWHHVVGSYAEPIGGDENPETYAISVPTTHTDHNAANNMRRINYWYRDSVLIPSERVPGFAFHQTERSRGPGQRCADGNGRLTSCYRRDFDLLGYKYSLLSQVATAGLNHVFCMLPARDEAEYALFPKEDIKWINQWLDFTDAHAAYLSRAVVLHGMGNVSNGRVDGTAAFLRPPSCPAGEADAEVSGFVFLFNPGYARQRAAFTIDDRLSTAHECQYAPGGGAAGGGWVVEEVHPVSRALAAASFGGEVAVDVDGSSAVVLRLTPKAAALRRGPVLIGAAGRAAASGGELGVADVRGEAGTERELSVLLPPGVPCRGLRVAAGALAAGAAV